ncbi:hypothetical protein C1878_14585 [Gordonibacter sp. 28C]|uniref:hypothetical protein n=1 Tax=Gordonibacter sp. 28C TaxID=2078569 RepID=UPI000DF7FCD8|nr:hypothetical protein [Gordonibacter sp. 28C]RDB59896.1 hypothetical protein C1878_14585 [Gordonibacter sp. 28C]
MEDTSTAPQLDLDAFTLASQDSVHVAMPPEPAASETDVDAQLFAYVAAAEKGSGIKSIADLDDAWVQSSFDGIGTIEELRAGIKRDLERQERRIWDNLKFQKCSDALVARLQGDLPDDVVAANIEASQAQYEARLRLMGSTKERYLREEHLTESQFDEKLRDDVLFQLKLNVVLDKMIAAEGIKVEKSELTEYLSTDDPDAFLAEIEANGRVEDACQAAARVKVMRRVVETAVVETEEDPAV